MRRVLAVGVVVAAFALASLPSVGAHGGVDQMNDWCDRAGWGGGSITYFDPMGQSFVPTRTRLLAVDLFLLDFTSDGVGTVLRVSIHRETIQGGVVGETTSEVPDVVPGSWWHFDFAKKLRLQPGQPYVIQVSVDNQPDDDMSAATAGPPGPGQDAYPDGTRIEKGVPTDYDLCFRTYGNGK